MAPVFEGSRGVNLGRFFIFLHDLAAATVAWSLAFWLRFNLEIPQPYVELMIARLPLVICTHAAVFGGLRMYRGFWRYASLPDLQKVVLAAGLSALAVPALVSFVQTDLFVPRTVYLLTPILLIMMMAGSRLGYRAWREGRLMPLVAKPNAIPVLVLGAGAAGASLVDDLVGDPYWRVVGLLDDASDKSGGEVVGVKVLGPVEDVGIIASRLGVTQAIIAMPSATHTQRRRAVDLCTAAGLSVMTVPALTDIVSGKVSVSELRRVELDDLLGRDPVELDEAGLHKLIEGRTVLVTGAGGSIGSELCRQIARYAPARIVLFDVSEFALYTIEQEFLERFPGVPLTAAIGDARDAARVAEVFEAHRPVAVFHAAAYKHVPLMEEGNAYQAVANNVLSTTVVARAARKVGVEKFVLVSTDKAVNPTNVMGASKRIAELVCQSLQDGGTQFVIVRFGNVLGSTGSVVPRFREQIARGGPVTVTHPEMTRYFMSIPEAAQLVLQAALMGRGGEIYVLDMGDPVRIVDLARQMIRLSGFAEADIPITFTGLRPGEKLYEEPLADAETTLPTPHPKLRIAKMRTADPSFSPDAVLGWLESGARRDPAAVREALRGWLPEYRPAAATAASGDAALPESPSRRRSTA